MAEFYNLVNHFLENLYNKLDQRYGDKADVDLVDGVLKLTLDSGQQIIINRHLASEELWMSSPISGGSHYKPHSDEWLDTKSNESFTETLNKDLAVLFDE